MVDKKAYVLTGICLDRHLLDHRPILLREVITDYRATPFRMYHSWFSLHGFEQMVTHTWNSIVLDDRNGMVHFKKKMQFLKNEIRVWVMDQKQKQSGRIKEIKSKLSDIDKLLGQRGVNDEILLSRMDLLKQMQDIKSSDARDCMQKAKIQWAIEGDENSKFFHGIINRKRANLAIKGVMVDGVNRSRLNFRFPNRLNPDQVAELENPITRDEIRNAMWACGENKSLGPDGFTFEFFRKFWNIIGSDLCLVVEWLFDHSSFTKGCSSSFVALIPKTHDPKFVSDYWPISLIGSLYKVVTKILATRLSMVISDLISDVQTAFLPNRQILDGPFIINELLSWCKHKKQQDMMFKVDFAKAYDSIRAVDARIFTGIKIDSSLTISQLFYVDDAVFIRVMVGGNSSTIKAWDDTIGKLKARLSNWKLKTLSIGGRLTLLKSVLGSTPINHMSLYKVPKSVLHLMKFICRNFFNGIQGDERKITWVKWSKEINVLKSQGVDLISHCKIRVGNGMRTQFWNDTWGSVALSLRRTVRGGVEAHQLDLL
nr:RNA-directed DNA polymerase, eukaryota, reverse transcriptase zinc-binding domain protein [Tanacetum cinerariifolium]